MNFADAHLASVVLAVSVALCPAMMHAADEQSGTNAASDVQVAELAEQRVGVEELTVGDAAPPRELTAPKVLDVKRAIGQLERDGVTIFTRVFNIDSSAGIDELFQQCRALDKAVVDRGPGRKAVEIEKLYESERFQKTFGMVRVRSAHFVATGPRKAAFLIKGRREVFDMDHETTKLVEAAEEAYTRASEALAMGQFMSWSKPPGRIYVITQEKLWKTLGTSGLRGNPVEIVLSDSSRREFFVYINAATHDYAVQALSYEVAAAVLDEYAMLATSRPTARLPLFYRTGMAAYLGDLEAVVALDGPTQVDLVVLPTGPVRVQRPKPGKMLPVKEDKLYSLEDLVSATAYPTDDEELYTFIRQCREMAHVISTNAPLATIALTRAISGGKDFREQIVLSYMEMQRDIQARPVVAPSEKSKPVRDESGRKISPDYIRFGKYMDLIFNTLTQEHFVEDYLRRKEERARKATDAQANEETDD